MSQFYTKRELAAIQGQIKNGNALMRAAVVSLAVQVHPRIAAARAAANKPDEGREIKVI